MPQKARRTWPDNVQEGDGEGERQKQRVAEEGSAGKGELNQGTENILSKAFATFSGANCVAAALKPGLPSINLFCHLPPPIPRTRCEQHCCFLYNILSCFNGPQHF